MKIISLTSRREINERRLISTDKRWKQLIVCIGRKKWFLINDSSRRLSDIFCDEEYDIYKKKLSFRTNRV